jgi:hypothetical protein
MMCIINDDATRNGSKYNDVMKKKEKKEKGVKFMINKHESYVIITYFLELGEVGHNVFVCSSTVANC